MSMEFAVFYYLKYTNTYGLVFMAESKAAFVDKNTNFCHWCCVGFYYYYYFIPELTQWCPVQDIFNVFKH